MAHYLFNLVGRHEEAARLLRAGMWGIGPDEPHRNALAAGDLVLVYLAAPERTFVGRAEVASAAHEWTTPEAGKYAGALPGGVLLAHVEQWDPPVPMSTVLSRLEPRGNARADFETGVVRITAHEYETALTAAVDARRTAL